MLFGRWINERKGGEGLWKEEVGKLELALSHGGDCEMTSAMENKLNLKKVASKK